MLDLSCRMLTKKALFRPMEVLSWGWILALEVLSRGWRLVLEVIPEVEESLIGWMKVGSWLQDAHKAQIKKLYLDLWKYFHGVEDGFGSTLKGLKIGFGSNPRGWWQPNWFNKSWILAAGCSQSSNLEGIFRPWDVLSWGWILALEVLLRGWRLVLKVIPEVKESLIG